MNPYSCDDAEIGQDIGLFYAFLYSAACAYDSAALKVHRELLAAITMPQKSAFGRLSKQLADSASGYSWEPIFIKIPYVVFLICQCRDTFGFDVSAANADRLPTELARLSPDLSHIDYNVVRHHRLTRRVKNKSRERVLLKHSSELVSVMSEEWKKSAHGELLYELATPELSAAIAQFVGATQLETRQVFATMRRWFPTAIRWIDHFVPSPSTSGAWGKIPLLDQVILAFYRNDQDHDIRTIEL